MSVENSREPGVCGCCLSVGRYRSLARSYSWLGTEQNCEDMLRECFDINMLEAGSAVICSVCATQLRRAHGFKQQVQRSQQRLARTAQAVGGLVLINKLITKTAARQKDKSCDNAGQLHYQVSTVDSVDVIAEEQPTSDLPDDRGTVEQEEDTQEQVVDGAGDFAMETLDAHSRFISIQSAAEEMETGDVADVPAEEVEIQDDDYIIAIEIAEEPQLPPELAADIENENVTSDTRCLLQHGDVTSALTGTQDITTVESHTMNEGSPTTFDTTDAVKRNAAMVVANSEVYPFRFAHDAYECFYCNQRYQDPAALRYHTTTVHIADKHNVLRYLHDNCQIPVDVSYTRCSLCEDSFTRVDNLIDHLSLDHGKRYNAMYASGLIPYTLVTAPLSCYICNQEFKTLENLQIHMEHCLYLYSPKSPLKTGDKNILECTHCNEKFESHTKLCSHVNAKHKLKPVCKIRKRYKESDQKRHLIRIQKQRPTQYPCQFCENVYATRRLVTNHTRRDHLKVRNYKCVFCDKTFYLKSQLDNHIVIHTGERSFICSVCDKTFNRKSNLMNHLALHGGVRPRACDICHEKFVTSGHLKWHKKRHHGDNILYNDLL